MAGITEAAKRVGEISRWNRNGELLKKKRFSLRRFRLEARKLSSPFSISKLNARKTCACSSALETPCRQVCADISDLHSAIGVIEQEVYAVSSVNPNMTLICFDAAGS